MVFTHTLQELNEYQREAVEDESRACLVKANVGSGKTTVLVAKILWLHQKKGIPFEKMAVLTFTNKAAEELGYRAGFTVIDPEEELDLAVSLIAEHGLKIKYKNKLKKRLEQEKKGWQQGREETRYQDDLFRLFALLSEEKIKRNRFSFSDLIAGCIRLMENGAWTPVEWVIVDEVQDSDRQQLEIHVKNHYDPFAEAVYLAERIRTLAKEGVPYREIAVFYRRQPGPSCRIKPMGQGYWKGCRDFPHTFAGNGLNVHAGIHIWRPPRGPATPLLAARVPALRKWRRRAPDICRQPGNCMNILNWMPHWELPGKPF